MTLPPPNMATRICILITSIIIIGGAVGTYFWTIMRAEELVKKAVIANHEGDNLAFSPLKFASGGRVCGQWAAILSNGQLGGWNPFVVLFQRGWAFTWREPMVLEPLEVSETDLNLTKKPSGPTDWLADTLAEYDRLAAASKVAERRRFDQLSVGCVPSPPQVRS